MSVPEIELISLKFVYLSESVEIVAIYRPPNSNLIEGFFAKMEEVLSNTSVREDIVLAGDLNICGLNNSQNSLHFINIAKSYCLIPHITIPTRPNMIGTDTQIDHIWTNFASEFKAGVFEDLGITDHLVNFVFIPMNIDRKRIKVTFRDHSDECIEIMKNRLINFQHFFPLLSANRNFNSKFDFFFDELDRIYKSSCPLKTKEISVNKIKKPWINCELSIKIKRKHYLFKRYKAGAILYSELKKLSSRVSRDLKKAKKDYFKNKFESYGGNCKQIWKTANDLMGKTSKKSPQSFSIIHEGNVTTDALNIANRFNEYFVNLGENLSREMLDSGSDPMDSMG